MKHTFSFTPEKFVGGPISEQPIWHLCLIRAALVIADNQWPNHTPPGRRGHVEFGSGAALVQFRRVAGEWEIQESHRVRQTGKHRPYLLKK
jgi:hypothetical protein